MLGVTTTDLSRSSNSSAMPDACAQPRAVPRIDAAADAAVAGGARVIVVDLGNALPSARRHLGGVMDRSSSTRSTARRITSRAPGAAHRSGQRTRYRRRNAARDRV